MKYFKFEEFENSVTAQKHGIDNSMPPIARRNIEILVNRVLDPARDKFGLAIFVNSGYRCNLLNQLIPNSSSHSFHLLGRAADVRPCDLSKLDDLFAILKDLPHLQLIKYKTFIHVAL